MPLLPAGVMLRTLWYAPFVSRAQRLLALAALATSACAPGYINAKQVAQRNQSPAACRKIEGE
jgi:hypothetical protein